MALCSPQPTPALSKESIPATPGQECLQLNLTCEILSTSNSRGTRARTGMPLGVNSTVPDLPKRGFAAFGCEAHRVAGSAIITHQNIFSDFKGAIGVFSLGFDEFVL